MIKQNDELITNFFDRLKVKKLFIKFISNEDACEDDFSYKLDYFDLMNNNTTNVLNQ